MNKFVNGDYKAALDGLLPVQGSLWRMGGSIAQRDLIEWTMVEAGIRPEKKMSPCRLLTSVYLSDQIAL